MKPFQIAGLTYVMVVILLYVLGQHNLEFLKLFSSIMLPLTSGFLVISAFSVFKTFGANWRGTFSRIWLSITVAASFLFLGNLLKAFSRFGLSLPTFLSLSLVDAIYVGEYVMLLFALIWILFMFEKAILRKNVVATSVVTIVLATGVSYLLLLPILTSQSTILDLILRVVYPFFVLFLFAISFLVFLTFFGGELGIAWCFITVSILFHTLGDLSYVYANLHNLYFIGHPLEILWLISYVLLIVGLETHRRQFKLD